MFDENNNENNNSREQNESLPEKRTTTSPTPMRRISRIFFRLVIFALVVFCIVAIGIGLWASRYLAPIKLEKADSDRLSGWLVFRNLNDEPEEVQYKLLQKYLDTFGPNRQEAPASSSFDSIGGMAGHYMERRSERVSAWLASLGPLEPWRCQYRVLPMPRARGEYPLSWEVVATPRLMADMEDSFWPPVPAPQTKSEQNLRLLTRRWFQLRMSEFDHLDQVQKRPFLTKTAKEMLWWQDYYNRFLVGVGRPAMTQTELLGELLFMTASWYEACSPEELARLLWFRDLLLQAAAQEQIKIGQKLSGKISSLPAALSSLDSMCRQCGIKSPMDNSKISRWLKAFRQKSTTPQDPALPAASKTSEDIPEAAEEATP